MHSKPNRHVYDPPSHRVTRGRRPLRLAPPEEQGQHRMPARPSRWALLLAAVAVRLWGVVAR